jgi:shikimate dehydrogenase
MNDRLRFAGSGHPKVRSIVPAMQSAALRALGLPHTYEEIEVPNPTRLAAFVDALRQGVYAGINIGPPHKRAVLDLVDRVDDSAGKIRAANTLVRSGGGITAHDTETVGLTSDLRALGAVGRTAVIIGSGGGASAAVAACVALGAQLVAVTARAWSSSEALVTSPVAEHFRTLGALPCIWPVASQGQTSSRQSEALRLQWADVAAGSNVIIQATSAGMRGGDPGGAIATMIPWNRVSRDALAYDLVYNPPVTPFLQAARERGVRAVNGLGMLARQGANALSLWLKVTPDVEIMRLSAVKALSGRE